MPSTRVGVIGAGFAGLSAASYLARDGYEVTLYEKHDRVGGRARFFEQDGFRFDMGPSWYWMPDTFERYFADFGKSVSDFYTLQKLDPGFRIYFGKGDLLDVPADPEALQQTLEALEPGSAAAYRRFMEDAARKYRVGMQDLVDKPCLHPAEFLSWKVLRGAMQMQLFTPFDRFVRRYFKHEKIIRLMEFPVLFLGAAPEKTPALYSMMNFAGLELGTFYPEGGMYAIVAGMEKLAIELGVDIQRNATIEAIDTNGQTSSGIKLNGKTRAHEVVVSAADYHHTDTKLLSSELRNYNEEYWKSRTMAPSSLLFYLGLDCKVPGLQHHNLFFDADFAQHTAEIYEQPRWPTDPLYYVCCPSKTDTSVAPEGGENIFILMPVAAGLTDSDESRRQYFDIILDRLEHVLGAEIRSHIVYQRSYCINDFVEDYGAFRGNAYGLANTLRQTAVLKPRIKNRKVKNLYYTGQLTVPGPGVPPSLISGKIVARQITKDYPNKLN